MIVADPRCSTNRWIAVVTLRSDNSSSRESSAYRPVLLSSRATIALKARESPRQRSYRIFGSRSRTGRHHRDKLLEIYIRKSRPLSCSESGGAALPNSVANIFNSPRPGAALPIAKIDLGHFSLTCSSGRRQPSPAISRELVGHLLQLLWLQFDNPETPVLAEQAFPLLQQHRCNSRKHSFVARSVEDGIPNTDIAGGQSSRKTLYEVSRGPADFGRNHKTLDRPTCLRGSALPTLI